MENEYAEVPASQPNRAENILADRVRTDDKDFQPDKETLGIWDEVKLAVMGVRILKILTQLYEQRNTMNNTTKTMLISTVVAVVLKGAAMLHWIPAVDDATAANIGNFVVMAWTAVFGIAAALEHHANSQAVSKTN